ncbi:serine/threonine protein kinase [Cryptosporangium sp. NPDC048952]|uniref:serine/threonine protein kinase n=1 Tax=Cryptosporangium sp. NPDC048952 TaxID=3363961 RepID=UPI00371AAD41
MAPDYEDPPTQTGTGEPSFPKAVRSEPPIAEETVWFVGPPEEPDRFEVTGPPTAGSEGVTWRARYTGRLNSPLAIAVKQLNRPPGAGLDWPSPAEFNRWQDHRILLQSMLTPHLVSVIDVFLGSPPHPADVEGSTGLIPYVVMPWIEGPSLARYVGGSRATARSLSERLALVRDLAEALGSLHAITRAGGNVLTHRDIKPGNCIVTPDRGLVLVDLGTLRLTADGFDDLGMHTPEYAAPEVLADPRASRGRSSDVYSLGAVAYFALVGADPPATDRVDAAGFNLRSVAASARVPDPEAFADHLLTAMHSDSAARPTDPVAWANELTRRSTQSRALTTRVLPAALVAVGMAVLCAVVLVWGQSIGGRSSTQAAVTPPADGFTPPVPTLYGVQILEPEPAHRVQRCAFFRGRSALPPGKTMVLAMHNRTNGEPVRYLVEVEDWDRPSRLGTWRGKQFFGAADSSVGQDYTVEVLVVDLGVVTRSKRVAQAAGELWTLETLPATWEVAAAVTVRRVAGPGNC